MTHIMQSVTFTTASLHTCPMNDCLQPLEDILVLSIHISHISKSQHVAYSPERRSPPVGHQAAHLSVGLRILS